MERDERGRMNMLERDGGLRKIVEVEPHSCKRVMGNRRERKVMPTDIVQVLLAARVGR